MLRNNSRIGLRKSETGRYQAIAIPNGIAIAIATKKPVSARVRLAETCSCNCPFSARVKNADTTSVKGGRKTLSTSPSRGAASQIPRKIAIAIDGLAIRQAVEPM